MRNKNFEDIFSGWQSGKLTPAEKIKSKKLGFLYRKDDDTLSTGVFFYSENEDALKDLVKSLIDKSKKDVISVIDTINYIKLGTIKKKNEEITIYINIDDIYRVDASDNIMLVNKIDEILLAYPLESIFIYRVRAKFDTIALS